MKLSIITINYNNKTGFIATAASIQKQTWRDFEWIIVDGSSKDGSKELIEELARNPENNISYWCSEPDKGIYDAMNKGVNKASGEWVIFMNSGDCFAYCSTLQNIFKDANIADILYGYMMRGSLEGRYNNPFFMNSPYSPYKLYFDTFPHQATFIKRFLFYENGLYDTSYKILADWNWFAKLVVKYNPTVVFIPRKISIYEGGGMSDNNNWIVERDRIRKEVFYFSHTFYKDVKNVSIIEKYRFIRTIYIILLSIAKVVEKIANRYRVYKISRKNEDTLI